jgi:hypothetical protein
MPDGFVFDTASQHFRSVEVGEDLRKIGHGRAAG